VIYGRRRRRTTALKVAAALEALALAIMEAQGEYYYDTRNVKRWVLGDGGKSGNCEICDENADLGWIDDDEVFIGVFGDIDGPEAHPNCTCTLEYKEQRYRVYI
jgi:hypothetical protein